MTTIRLRIGSSCSPFFGVQTSSGRTAASLRRPRKAGYFNRIARISCSGAGGGIRAPVYQYRLPHRRHTVLALDHVQEVRIWTHQVTHVSMVHGGISPNRRNATYAAIARARSSVRIVMRRVTTLTGAIIARLIFQFSSCSCEPTPPYSTV